MENKKLMIKNGATLKDTFLVIIGFIVAYGIMLAFITSSATQGGVTVDASYNTSYTKLQLDQQKLSNNTDEILSALSNVSEAKIGDFAYFGLKGMWAVFKSPFTLINIATDSIGISTTLLDFIPDTIKGGITLGLLAIVLFAGIRFATSRNNDP